MSKETIIKNLQELSEWVPNFLTDIKKDIGQDTATLIQLEGDLGAGKTTLVQHAGQVLGVTETITSPTFVIMKEYATADPVFQNIIHIDAYRLSGGVGDLEHLGWNEWIQQPHTLIFLEWPRMVTGITLPKNTYTLSLRITEQHERNLVIHKN